MHDRRAADRPANGDTALCPQCGIGTVEFNERYRVLLASGKTASIPAWACDRPECRFERAARSDVRPVQSNSADLRARSRRQLMKARAVLHRARRTISKSLSRKKRH